jgi:hypothetical protein
MKGPFLTVRYLDTDPSQARPDSFLSRLAAAAAGTEVHVIRDPRVPVDLQFTSVQHGAMRRVRHLSAKVKQRMTTRPLTVTDARWKVENPRPRGSAGTHVWFTGENQRPPSEGWDATLSFDIDPLSGSNAYLPLWWHSVGLLGTSESLFIKPAPSIHELVLPRSGAPMPAGFAVALINNPHPMRFHAINLLKRIGQVDVFGRAVGRTLPNKATLKGRYKFVVCFENDLYPGYVTEKALEAYAMGSVPLWWGSDPEGYLNRGAIVNAAEYASLQDFALEVERISLSEPVWQTYYAQPLITRSPDLNPAVRLLRTCLTRDVDVRRA